jgi:hypothetical protein
MQARGTQAQAIQMQAATLAIVEGQVVINLQHPTQVLLQQQGQQQQHQTTQSQRRQTAADGQPIQLRTTARAMLYQ